MINQPPPSPAASSSPPWDPVKILQISNPDAQGWTCKGTTQTNRRCRRFLGAANRDAIDTILPKISPISPSNKTPTSSTTSSSPVIPIDENRQLNILSRCCLCYDHDDELTAREIAAGWAKDLEKARSSYITERTRIASAAQQYANKPSPKSFTFTFTPGPVGAPGGPPNGIPARTTSQAQAQVFPNYLSPRASPTPTPASGTETPPIPARNGRQSLSPFNQQPPTPTPTPQSKTKTKTTSIKKEKQGEFTPPQSIFSFQPTPPRVSSFTLPNPNVNNNNNDNNTKTVTETQKQKETIITPPQSIFSFQPPPPRVSSFTLPNLNLNNNTKPVTETETPKHQKETIITPPTSSFTFQSPPLPRNSSLAAQSPSQSQPQTPKLNNTKPRIKQEQEKYGTRTGGRNHFYYEEAEEDEYDDDEDDDDEEQANRSRASILDHLKEQEETLRRATRQHSELIERLEGMRI